MPGGKKVPFRITRNDGKLFAFAGIWEESPPDAGLGLRFAIVITTAANAIMHPIYARLLVILDDGEERAWLAGANSHSRCRVRLGPPRTSFSIGS